MADFMRTISGLNNIHVFHDVDVILYCEGGSDDFNLDDVIDNDKHADSSNDIYFWNMIFEKFKSGKKVKIKSVGSCGIIIGLKKHILDNNIKNTYVARDRDFTHMNIIDNKIDEIELITYGYSWENDVLNIENANKIYRQLTRTQYDQSIIEYIQNTIKKFGKKLLKIISLDINLFTYYNESAFNKKKCCARLIKCNGEPELIGKEFLKDFKLIKDRIQSKVNFSPYVNCTFDTDCQGHLLAEIYYRLITYMQNKKLSKKSILKKDELMTMAINYFVPQSNPIYMHYNDMMKKVR